MHFFDSAVPCVLGGGQDRDAKLGNAGLSRAVLTVLALVVHASVNCKATITNSSACSFTQYTEICREWAQNEKIR